MVTMLGWATAAANAVLTSVAVAPAATSVADTAAGFLTLLPSIPTTTIDSLAVKGVPPAPRIGARGAQVRVNSS